MVYFLLPVQGRLYALLKYQYLNLAELCSTTRRLSVDGSFNDGSSFSSFNNGIVYPDGVLLTSISFLTPFQVGKLYFDFSM